MKKIMSLAAVLAFAFLVSGVAYAEMIEGEVITVDLEGNTLNVQKAAGEGGVAENVKVSVNETTTYSGEVTAFAEIIEGDTAKVEAAQDPSGNWTASSVDISVEEEELAAE